MILAPRLYIVNRPLPQESAVMLRSLTSRGRIAAKRYQPQPEGLLSAASIKCPRIAGASIPELAAEGIVPRHQAGQIGRHQLAAFYDDPTVDHTEAHPPGDAHQ